MAALRLKFHFLHNWQTGVHSGADHKSEAFPGNLFVAGQRRMPKLVTECPGGLLLALSDLPAVDDQVLLISASVDSEGTEGEFVEVSTRLLLVQKSYATSSYGDGNLWVWLQFEHQSGSIGYMGHLDQGSQQFTAHELRGALNAGCSSRLPCMVTATCLDFR